MFHETDEPVATYHCYLRSIVNWVGFFHDRHNLVSDIVKERKTTLAPSFGDSLYIALWLHCVCSVCGEGV